MSSEELEALATPEEHANATGNTIALKLRRTVNGKSAGTVFSVAHMGAAQLHGWLAHKQATTDEFKLSRAAYLAALECALKGDGPHASACSQYAPKFGPAEEPAQTSTTKRKAK